MTKPIALLTFAAVTLAVGLAGCSAGTGSSDVSGVWGTPDATDTPGLELKADQSATGTDGCNRLVGTWSLTGDTIEFGTFASTLMACEGVDTWLGKASTATVDGSVMTVQDSDGAEIGTLDRAD
ncbi:MULTISPECIES: META domain-containing protein [Cryobacterium]|uniref:META domain-containing protein n=1 Tax=Cryobacterium breve TaxID=1259258 RepID=A0ABY2IW27_9MICO|nr:MULTISPECIES: META domain-containing protein [Cryobacterium]TFC93144.1 META domain-containing protein [Cryobacterium sp. TmT3-12]TFC96129.1 META domain-containing protein [Cryobacterium breve]